LNTQRQYSQLYYLDPDEANNERINHEANAGCDPVVFRIISNVLYEIIHHDNPPIYRNPFITCYKTMKELEQQERERAAADGRPFTVTMTITKTTIQDDR
jgi:hypothetical protein